MTMSKKPRNVLGCVLFARYIKPKVKNFYLSSQNRVLSTCEIFHFLIHHEQDFLANNFTVTRFCRRRSVLALVLGNTSTGMA